MPLVFQCPHCGRNLPVSPMMVGHRVTCAECKKEFKLRLPRPANGAASEAPATTSPPRATAPPLAAPPVAAPPVASGPRPALVANAMPLPTVAPSVAPAPVTVSGSQRTARFIAAASADSSVQLTAGGKLPELQLTAVEKKDSQKAARQSNPLLLIGVLGMSVGLSLLMLLVDFDGSSAKPPTVSEARQTVASFYEKPRDVKTQELDRYQVLLREASQAASRGDQKKERENYRSVLGLLRAENRDPYRGVTGSTSDDRRLEAAISVLLANMEP